MLTAKEPEVSVADTIKKKTCSCTGTTGNLRGGCSLSVSWPAWLRSSLSCCTRLSAWGLAWRRRSRAPWLLYKFSAVLQSRQHIPFASLPFSVWLCWALDYWHSPEKRHPVSPRHGLGKGNQKEKGKPANPRRGRCYAGVSACRGCRESFIACLDFTSKGIWRTPEFFFSNFVFMRVVFFPPVLWQHFHTYPATDCRTLLFWYKVDFTLK